VATEGITGRAVISRASGLGEWHGGQPRDTHVGGLRSAWRRCSTLDAASSRRRQWNVPVGELIVPTGSLRTGEQAFNPLWRGSLPQRQAHAAGSQDHQAQGSKGLKIAGKPLKRLDTAGQTRRQQSLAIDLKLPGMLNAQSRLSVFAESSRVTTRARSLGMPREEGGAGAGHRRCGRRRYLVQAKKALEALRCLG